MNLDGAATRPNEIFRLVYASAGLLALASILGVTVNIVRPTATRLPWKGDWEHHIETKAFRAGIPVVFLAGVRERVEDPAVIVFDARTRTEYAAGHLPRAYTLPVGETDTRLGSYAQLLTPQTPILVYCNGAQCADSLDLALKLREYGFKNISLYPGGYAEWTQYGGIVRTGDEP